MFSWYKLLIKVSWPPYKYVWQRSGDLAGYGNISTIFGARWGTVAVLERSLLKISPCILYMNGWTTPVWRINLLLWCLRLRRKFSWCHTKSLNRQKVRCVSATDNLVPNASMSFFTKLVAGYQKTLRVHFNKKYIYIFFKCYRHRHFLLCILGILLNKDVR